MKGLGDIMKQAQAMQGRMTEMQKELEELEVKGASGAGLVSVTLSGKGNLKDLSIDASLMKPEETEILEDLIVAAHSDAKTRLEEAMAEKMKEVTGGMPLPPGMNLF